MRLFTMKDWELTLDEKVWALVPFKRLLDKDKSKGKEKAHKEMLFIWYYCDIKSDYDDIIDLNERYSEIKRDLKMPSAWKITKDVQEAIDFYKKRSSTVSSKILDDSMYIANKLSSRMKQLVDDDESELSGTSIKNLLEGLKKMPEVVMSLQQTEKAVLKELEQKKGNIGKQNKGLFEEGLQIDEI